MVTLLVIIVVILAFLTGLAVLIGSRDSEKERSVWLFLSAGAIAVWSAFIVTFLQLPEAAVTFTEPVIGTIYVSAIIIPLTFAAYMVWPYKYGRVFTSVTGLLGVGLAFLFIAKNDLLYAQAIVSESGNAVVLNTNSWFLPILIAYLVLLLGGIVVTFLHNLLKTRSKRKRWNLLLALVGICLGYAGIGAFGLVLPFYWSYDIIIAAPLLAGLFIVAFYYAILRYKIIAMDSKWLKILSYIIIMTAAAVVYMVIFFLIVTFLFQMEDTPETIFVLNFVMISIVLLLIPVINEAMSVVTARIRSGQANMTYILKKLNNMAVNKGGVDIDEIADFLADYLHFSFIGIIVKGKLYGSTSTKLTTGEIKEVMSLGQPERGVWQEYGGVTEAVLTAAKIEAVAAMRDVNGKPFGQMIVGRPVGKRKLERRDLIQLEMVVNLVAAMIDTAASKARRTSAHDLASLKKGKK